MCFVSITAENNMFVHKKHRIEDGVLCWEAGTLLLIQSMGQSNSFSYDFHDMECDKSPPAT